MSSHLQTNDSGFSASGRFGRLSYLGWNMLLVVFVFILGIIAAFLVPAFSSSSTGSSLYVFGGLFVIVYIAMIYFSFIFSIRRLHDRNQKVLGWIYIVIFPLSILAIAATAIPAYQNYIQKSQQIQMEQMNRYAE